ncbi:MAG TPA: tetratricopeptide repeat protein [Blastocatellia bacterium]|jgi:tetratricopeptide (TPR) repeat protein|nr:tetratricopeptide repeat protein [Blastocatellia bacterium]
MSLFNSVYRLVGKAGGAPVSRPDFSPLPLCPDEAAILNYLEGKSSPRERMELEGHFASCGECRELLVLFIKIPDEQVEGYDANLDSLSEEGVKKQTARILAFIENDERRRSQSAGKKTSRAEVAKKREGIYVSYPVLASLALIICAVAGLSIFWLGRDHRPQDGMEALKLAVKDERRTPARISGGLAHSPYAGTRGEEDTDGLQFERALHKLKYAAEDASASPEARLALARVHLALGKRDEARKALAILEQLVASGNQSAEVLNDLGVAQFQLENHSEAISDFSKALEKSPAFSEALFNKALAEEHDDRIEAAKQDWQLFLNSSSDAKWNAEAQRNLQRLQSSSKLIEAHGPVRGLPGRRSHRPK